MKVLMVILLLSSIGFSVIDLDPDTRPVINESETVELRINVYNPADIDKIFHASAKPSIGQINPSSFRIDIPAESNQQKILTYTVPSVEEDTTVEIDVEVCELSQTGSLCDEQTFLVNVKDTGDDKPCLGALLVLGSLFFFIKF